MAKPYRHEARALKGWELDNNVARIDKAVMQSNQAIYDLRQDFNLVLKHLKIGLTTTPLTRQVVVPKKKPWWKLW